jgi:serine/threonine-protein kinase PpkA
MPGKKTLFQKVITLPRALPRKDPKDSPDGEPIKPFTVLYVYDRRDDNGRLWLQCSEGTTGKDLFWVRDDRVAEWKQSMVLLFSEKAGRAPLLFFNEKSDILGIAGKPGIRAALEELAKLFARYRDSKEAAPPGFPVSAMEPMDSEGAVPRDQFYIMPIFSYDDSLEVVKLLEVASINPGSAPDEVVNELPPEPKDAQGKKEPKAAVCFVIDTTQSMGPYINAARRVIKSFYDKVMQGPNPDGTFLAFVAFRSSPQAAPLTEYNTKLIADFTSASDRGAFDEALSRVQEAEHSTHSFNEDSIAGINRALKLDWEKYGGGVIMLISDAGPLPRSDKRADSRDDPLGVRAKAEKMGVRIVTIHLKTPEGSGNHRYAQGAYESMAFEAQGNVGYIDIPVKTAEDGTPVFAETTDDLMTAFADATHNPGSAPPPAPEPEAKEESPQDRARKLGSLLGYSVRLDYLGTQNKVTAPTTVRSWIPDKDLGFLDGENPRHVRTVQVAVLLSKSQLSSLSQAVRSIIAGAEEMLSGGGRDFYDAVLSAAVKVGRDPGEFSRDPSRLGDSGLMGEYLEGLPYVSRVMSLTQETWDSWTPNQQREFILELESKVAQYEFFDSDVKNWAQFGDESDGDWLYRVPLSALP